MGSLSLLQRIYPNQELNWGLLLCRCILYKLSYQGSPIYTCLCVCVCVGFPRWLSSKELFCQRSGHRKCGFDSWVGKIPWRRKWQLTPVFLPGESHGQRSQVDYSSWGCKESDVTEQLSLHEYIYILTHMCTHMYIYSTSLNNSLGRYLINNLLI